MYVQKINCPNGNCKEIRMGVRGKGTGRKKQQQQQKKKGKKKRERKVKEEKSKYCVLDIKPHLFFSNCFSLNIL